MRHFDGGAQPTDGERRRAGGAGPLARQALVFAAAWGLYNLVRITTEGSTGRAMHHAERLLHLENSLGIAWERSAQELVLARPFLVDFFNTLYALAFWPTIAVSLVALYVRDLRRYLVLRDALFVSGAIGLVIFASFPVAPPRFLDGFVDTIAVLSSHDGIARPEGLANQYAALPSFHVGWMVLSAIVVRTVIPWRIGRVAPFLLAFLMVVAVIVTANHYVVDALAGTGVSLLGLAGAHRIERMRVHRESERVTRLVVVEQLPVDLDRHRTPRTAGADS
jgi:hypothetical protein